MDGCRVFSCVPLTTNADGKRSGTLEFNPLENAQNSDSESRRRWSKEGVSEFANFKERFQNLFSLISLMRRAHGRTSAHGTKLAVLCKFDTAK